MNPIERRLNTLFAVECGVRGDAPRAVLRVVGVEIPDDQRTSTSSDCEDLDDVRAYFVLLYLRHVLHPL